ncbi:hypothetical protein BASA83_011631 [Batrachochytrium salamandrivorans]|nr:hypothetical protein BASA83_011631 [Batrachochytrium salamandrivorans]
MARSLLTSADTSRWKAALESYAYALDTLAATKKKPASGLDLVQLDEWRRGLDSTSELDKAAVLRIVQWKLRRGTFRPTLLAAVASNSEKTILTATTAAKLLLSQTSSSCKHPSTSKILDAIKVVSELTGVGPATASAILACSSDRVPFMSDEALVALQGTDPAKLKYTIKQYTELLTVLTEKAAELNHAAASSSTAINRSHTPCSITRVVTTIHRVRTMGMPDLAQASDSTISNSHIYQKSNIYRYSYSRKNRLNSCI